MKSHTSDFKEEIKLLGKQQDVRITYTIDNEQIVLSSEDINSATPNYEASLLKSVMKGFDLDSNVSIPKGTEIKFEYGLLVNGAYEYLDYGNYIVAKEPEKQEDTLSYKISCYDKMLYSMKDYEHIEVTYPITIYEYLKAVCNKIGLQMKETNFANMLRQVPSELFMTVNEDGTYSSMGYTYRDVLDQIAEVTGGCICLTLDDKVEVRYINETNDTINEEYINDTNVNFGEKYGPINSIVLARAGESDKIYKKDQNSINENGLCELMISENQFMNFNDRVDYLQELSDKLFGVEYYLNDFVSTGIMYYDLLDMYNIEIFGKTYNCLMLNDEQDITQGLEENIHTDRPEKSETDYTKADTTDRKINQTNLIVDKQNQKIEALVTSNTELNQKTAQLRIDVDTIAGEISDIADVTTTADGNGTITFENVNESEPVFIKIHPQTNDLIPLYLDDNIYLSDDLYMHNIELYFKNTTDDTEIIYNIPNELYYLDGIYDEFVIDYENQQCYITHRIEKVNGEKRLKEIETTEELPYPTIRLTEGDYTITIPYNLTTYIYARLMSKNLYTSQFATKVEVNSKITQTAQDITLSTNKKLENYSTTTQMNSAITVKANEITSSVSQTYETKENATKQYSNIKQTTDSITSEVGKKVGNNEIISKINQSAEAVSIDAKKININGTVSANGNFKIDREGNLEAKNGNFLGNVDIGENDYFRAKDNKGNILMQINKNGSDYYFNNVHVGKIGTDGVETDSSKRGLMISIDKDAYFLGLGKDNGTGTAEPIYAWYNIVTENTGTYAENTQGRVQIGNSNWGFFVSIFKTLMIHGNAYADSFINTSLESQKKNFEKLTIEEALEILNSTDIYKYNLKSQEDDKKKHIGFVIGDNFKYSQKITSENNSGVDNYSMTSILYPIVKQQQKQIEELKKEIEILKGEKNE